MSTDADKATACPNEGKESADSTVEKLDCTDGEKKRKKGRSVRFPEEDQLVTQYFEPANPWFDVPLTSKSQLASEYLEACRTHGVTPIDTLLDQIRELPDNAIGGGTRASRLSLSDCVISGSAAADALESVLKKVQFKTLELDHACVDDEAVESLFDMVEYYESATSIVVSGPRHFGIRGWQAASRMIKKSAELAELEVSDAALEVSHCEVIARAVRAHTCQLRSLSLQRVQLAGPLAMALVIALKSNVSIRELRLGDNGLTCKDASQLASLLRVNSHIQLLDVSNNFIEDTGVQFLTDAIVSQANNSSIMSNHEGQGLAFLVLWNNQLTKDCAPHLSRALRASSSLCVLNIGRNTLGAATVRELEHSASRLVSLGLQASRLGPPAAAPLRALLSHPSLTRLDLRDNKLGEAVLQAIVSAMQDNTTLTQIDLDEPQESSLLTEDPQAEAIGRLTREIRALCRRNEPKADPLRAHRKMSLTCHTALCPATSLCASRRGRLRSPAPSPAASPVPPLDPNRELFLNIIRESDVSVLEDKRTDSVVNMRKRKEWHNIQRKFCEKSGTSHRTVSQLVGLWRRLRQAAIKKGLGGGDNNDPLVHRNDINTSDFSLSKNSNDSMDSISVAKVKSEKSDVILPVEFDEEARSELSSPINSDDESSRSTPERDGSCSSDSSNPPTPTKTFCPTPSRFKVVQVVEPPQIHVNAPKQEKPRRSRFSVTRNYDSSFNPTFVPSPSPDPSGSSPEPDVSSPKQVEKFKENPKITPKIPETKNIKTNNDVKIFVDNNNSDKNRNEKDSVKSEVKCDNGVTVSDQISCNYRDSSEELSHNETVGVSNDGKVVKTETKLVKSSKEMSAKEKVDVQVEITVAKEVKADDSDVKQSKVHSDQKLHSRIEVNVGEDVGSNIDKSIDKIIDKNVNKKEGTAMKQIEAITEDLGNLIQEMRDLSTKTAVLIKPEIKVKTDCTQTDVDVIVNSKINSLNQVPANLIRDSLVLKKNKSESSLDSPDLEVSRLMNKKLVGSAFCDSSSSLEISGSSMESLNENPTQIIKPMIIQSMESDTELDRRKTDVKFNTGSSVESNTSDLTPVNTGNLLNMSVSSNESVSPIIFSASQKANDSLSSLEASVSSLESTRHEKMVTSADSGIEYSLQNPSETKDDISSNEGTLTNNSSLQDAKKTDSLQETLTMSPKRASSLLDVPALKSKGLERMRKISWVAPSPSFHVPRPEPEKIESKLPTHLEKLLSLFQHPTSLFSRNINEEERKSASNTPPRKDSSLTSSFWSWGSNNEKLEKEEKSEDRDSISEATDSTLSERVQVSFVDESLSKKMNSKTPSTDTDNTLSEFQSFPIQGNSETSELADTEKVEVTELTTDDNLVQKSLGLSLIDDTCSDGNCNEPRTCDTIDLMKPNDLNKNIYDTVNTPAGDSNKNSGEPILTIQPSGVERMEEKGLEVKLDELKPVETRPRTFAAVLKSSGSENSLEKQLSPDTGQPVDKLPSKVIRGIKENISPENTLTSSMSNTKALALELTEKEIKNQPIVNTVWEVTMPILDKNDAKVEKTQDLAPIATIEEAYDENIDNVVITDKTDDRNISLDSGVTSLEGTEDNKKTDSQIDDTAEVQSVDLGKDALSYLIYENQDFEPDTENSVSNAKAEQGSLAQELKEAELKEKLIDLSPELVIDEASASPEVFTIKKSIIPERAKLKKSNSLEDLSKRLQSVENENPKPKSIVFKFPDTTTTPRDIPERRKLRSRSGSSPKSLPESLNKPCPLSKLECGIKKKKKVSSLGKMARDSLLALNMSEDEIAEFRRSSKLTSVESLRSLESVSEDANSQSGNSVDSRCRSCLRLSQESLMSLDSINEDCKCDERVHSAR